MPSVCQPKSNKRPGLGLCADVMKQLRQKKAKFFDENPDNPINVDQYEPSIQPESPKQWIPELRLELRHKEILQSPTAWLDDTIINASQRLIQTANPAVPGLQDVICGLGLSFKVQPEEFIHILHDGNAHWLTISTIGLQQAYVQVFDSLLSVPSSSVKLQISSLLMTNESQITLSYVDVQRQMGGSNCGLFSVAFATALGFGQQPGLLVFDEARMRGHLMQCLEDRQMSMFPVKKAKRLVRVKANHKVKVYCICRMPSCTDSSWIACSGCK